MVRIKLGLVTGYWYGMVWYTRV